ncbi:MAG: hypothetical protein KIT83_10370 [Bryobacterales bacterium]|nr:hypothetical protein [Bryobacterales bacterium]
MKGTTAAIYLVHVGATLGLTGLCWFVQVVHYPLFAAVGKAGFSEYALLHARRTSLIVGPLMLAELASGLAILAIASAQDSGPGAAWAIHGAPVWLWFSTAMLAAIWLSTMFVQVPLHGKLALGFDAELAARLMRTNWLRTWLWTARSLILLVMLQATLAPPRDVAASSIQ